MDKFAVSDGYRGRGVGKCMKKNILTIVFFTSRYVGCCYIIVESKEESVYYYEHVKFKPTSHADDVHMLMIRKTEFA